ncbi:hypothetical protein SEVIR_7G201750v4 [Setaria viridis]
MNLNLLFNRIGHSLLLLTPILTRVKKPTSTINQSDFTCPKIEFPVTNSRRPASILAASPLPHIIAPVQEERHVKSAPNRFPTGQISLCCLNGAPADTNCGFFYRFKLFRDSSQPGRSQVREARQGSMLWAREVDRVQQRRARGGIAPA